ADGRTDRTRGAAVDRRRGENDARQILRVSEVEARVKGALEPARTVRQESRAAVGGFGDVPTVIMNFQLDGQGEPWVARRHGRWRQQAAVHSGVRQEGS